MDDTISLLEHHRQVYVDLDGIQWLYPRVLPRAAQGVVRRRLRQARDVWIGLDVAPSGCTGHDLRALTIDESDEGIDFVGSELLIWHVADSRRGRVSLGTCRVRKELPEIVRLECAACQFGAD